MTAPHRKAEGMTTVRTEAAFTPGPWWVRGDGDVTVLAKKTHKPEFSEALHYDGEVARVQPQSKKAERRANARLIAAAPDMFQTLECAKMALERVDISALGWGEEPHETLGKNVVPVAEELLALINNALARARGDAPSSKGLMDG